MIFTDLPRLPTLGTEVFTDGFGAHVGGGAFITAAHLSQLGHASSLAAMLPAPPFSDVMRPELEASGIDLSLCAPLSEAEGPQITVALAQDGDRGFLTRRAGPAFPEISASDLIQRGADHLHVGELESLIERPDVVRLARSQGMTVSVDCGWSDAFDIGALEGLVGLADVFLPNEAEFAALKQAGLTLDFAPITVVKRGRFGATVISKDGMLSVPAIEAEVVDTTGAGDAFNAGFLSSWLRGDDLRSCLEAGNRRGALTVQKRGGFTPGPDPVSAMDFAEASAQQGTG